MKQKILALIFLWMAGGSASANAAGYDYYIHIWALNQACSQFNFILSEGLCLGAGLKSILKEESFAEIAPKACSCFIPPSNRDRCYQTFVEVAGDAPTVAGMRVCEEDAKRDRQSLWSDPCLGKVVSRFRSKYLTRTTADMSSIKANAQILSYVCEGTSYLPPHKSACYRNAMRALLENEDLQTY